MYSTHNGDDRMMRTARCGIDVCNDDTDTQKGAPTYESSTEWCSKLITLTGRPHYPRIYDHCDEREKTFVSEFMRVNNYL